MMGGYALYGYKHLYEEGRVAEYNPNPCHSVQSPIWIEFPSIGTNENSVPVLI